MKWKYLYVLPTTLIECLEFTICIQVLRTFPQLPLISSETAINVKLDFLRLSQLRVIYPSSVALL